MSQFFDLVAQLQTSIDALDDVLAGDENSTVSVNGQSKDTISKAIKDRFAAIQAAVQGRVAFATKALMDADLNHAADTLAEVWNDASPANNGLYGKTGASGSGSWVPSSFDRVGLIESQAATRGWPWRVGSTFEGSPTEITQAIIDIDIVGGDPAWRVVPYTCERAGAYGHYVRLGVVDENDVQDGSVGNNSIIARFVVDPHTEPALVDGRRLEKLTLTPQNGAVDSATVLIDWEALTPGAVNGIKSYAKAGFDGRIFRDNRVAQPVTLDQIRGQLSKASPLWAGDVDFGVAPEVADAILDLTLYGADPTKRYGIELLRMEPAAGGRSFFGICEFAADGTKGARVALWDDTSYTQPATVNGTAIAEIYVPAANGSGVSAELKIDWAKLPQSGPYWDGSRWYTNAFQVTDGEFSQFVRQTSAPALTGYGVIDFQLDGVDARLTTSDGYDAAGEPDTLLLLCHGNGGNYTYQPSASFISYCRANKISFACISGQDETAAPFSTAASGWGGPIHYARVLRLHQYLMDNYNLRREVIVAGASMGGLVMGQLAYNKPFPIRFCLGVGPVPSLEYIFDNGGSSRQVPIRNAFGMDAGGSDDANLAEFTQGQDWYKMGMLDIGGTLHKVGFPRLYLYLGTGDTTANVDFGGIAKYEEIRDAIRAAGGFCVTKDVGAVSHADATIYDAFLADGVMDAELELNG